MYVSGAHVCVCVRADNDSGVWCGALCGVLSFDSKERALVSASDCAADGARYRYAKYTPLAHTQTHAAIWPHTYVRGVRVV